MEFGVDYDFFDKNKIKTTNKSLYEQLDLKAKINLYNLAKKFKNENSSISNVPIDSIKDIIGFTIDVSKINLNNLATKKIINAFDKGYFSDPTITSGDIIYLGPTDYNKLLASASSNTVMNVIKSDEYVLDSDIKKPKNRKDKTFKVDIDRIFTEEDIKFLRESLDERYNNTVLSRREKISIQNQFAICYKNAISKTKKINKFNITVVLNINRVGFIDINNIKIEPLDIKVEYSSSEYRDAINSVKLALDYCNPIRNLPLGKYEAWKTIRLIFNSN